MGGQELLFCSWTNPQHLDRAAWLFASAENERVTRVSLEHGVGVEKEQDGRPGEAGALTAGPADQGDSPCHQPGPAEVRGEIWGTKLPPARENPPPLLPTPGDSLQEALRCPKPGHRRRGRLSRSPFPASAESPGKGRTPGRPGLPSHSLNRPSSPPPSRGWGSQLQGRGLGEQGHRKLCLNNPVPGVSSGALG